MTYYSISAALIALTSFILGVFVFAQQPRKQNHQIFFLFSLSVMIWSGCYFFWQIADTSSQAIFWSHGLMIGATLIPFIYFHFIIILIDQWAKFRRIMYVGYIFVILSLAVNTSPYFISSVSSKLSFSYWPNPGILFHPFLLLWGIIVIYQIVILIRAYKKAQGINKRQLLYLLSGTILGYIGGSMNYLLWYNIPIPPIGNILVLVYVGITAYTILRYRLFDVKIQFQKVFNIIVPIIVAVGCAGIIGFLIENLGFEWSMQLGVIMLTLALFLAQFFQWLLQKTPVRYWFFRRVYRYQVALRQLAESAPKIVHLDELTEKIVTVLSDDMRVKQVGIVIVGQEYQFHSKAIRTIGFNPEQLKVWSKPTPLMVAAFDHNNRLSFVTDEIDYELQGDLKKSCQEKLLAVKKALHESNASLVLGLKVQKSILGFLVLGEQVNRSYTKEDIALLEDISHQLAVALMHSRIHETKTTMTHVLQDNIERATQELQEKLEENEELSKVKSQFIEVASHQLRTPISVIRNSLEMIIQDYVKPAQEKGMPPEEVKAMFMLLNNAFLASDNLNNTLSSILAAEEFIGGKPGVEVDSVKIESFLKQRMTRAHNLLQAKKTQDITLVDDISSDLPEMIITDDRKLGMIIDQLLMNALLYTQKGEVRFRMWPENDSIMMEVCDTGIGISSEEQEKLFQRFVRLKNAQNVVPDGTGLGLYLIRKYIELLRGQVLLCSELGKGTTVRVRIPAIYQYIGS